MPVSDDLWNYIDSQISNKKERPKYWIFFLISLIIVPGSYLTHKVFNNQFDLNQIVVENKVKDLTALVSENSQQIFSKDTNTQGKGQIQTIERINAINLKFIKTQNLQKQSLSFQIITKKINATNYGQPDLSIDREMTSQTKLQPLDRLLNTKLSSSSSQSEVVFEKGRFAGVPQCPSFNRKNDKLYLFTNGSINYPIQFLSSPGNENNTYINSRKSTESSFASYSFDAGLGYQFTDNWFIQAGIMYNQINMKFHLIEEGQTRNTTYTRVDTLRDNNGLIVGIETDTFISQEVGIEETLTLNKFKQLDIPVSVGYRFPVSRRFNLALAGGVIFNLRNQSSGTILNPKGEPLDYGKDVRTDGPLYSSKVGLSFTGAVKLETEIYPDLFMNAGLDLRYYGGNFGTTDNPIQQNYLSVGLGTGLRYKF